MGQLFGTDGVRGLANVELTSELAYKLGQAGAYVLTLAKHKPRILIGKDTRVSGYMLEAAMIAGICSVGAEAVTVGVIPTPAVAYLTRYYGLDAGVAISASHNPMEYNGIKFFDKRGYKLPDELELRIENIVLNNSEEMPKPTGIKVGRRTRVRNAVRDYVDFLKSTADTDLSGLRIVIDCANGASFRAAPMVLESLGAEVIIISNTPDGTNINDYCGSTYPKNLQSIVLELGADVGLAFDGDADRLIAVDNVGNIMDGDKILAVCGVDMKNRGKLKKNTVVATVMSNLGLDTALKSVGCSVEKTNVGDRNVLEHMLANGYNLGGEQSGHVIFLDHNTTGDGLLTAIKLLSVVKHTGRKLSELGKVMEQLPQVLVNAYVPENRKNDYKEDSVIMQEIGNIEARFADEGRVLIRPSGTEPMVRVMIEGKDQGVIEEYAVKLAKLIEERLN